MTELERKIIEKAGLSLADFEPRQNAQTAQNNADADARIAELEQAIRILMGGAVEDAE